MSSELAKIYERENQTNNTNAWKSTSRAKSPIGKDIVEKWLSEKIKDINQFLISVYFEYQFWSVRGFLKEAKRILKEAKNKTRKYEINYFDKNEMKKYATKYQAKKFLEHIHKHFN